MNKLVFTTFFLFFMPLLNCMAQSDLHSGTCGWGLTWTYSEEIKTLTISGAGDMSNYDRKNNTAPWYNFRRDIQSIIIGPEVYSIGDCAFVDVSTDSIAIPNSVARIGKWAFFSSELESLTIPHGITTLEESTFNGCRSLTKISLPNTLTSIGDKAFYKCRSLKSIEIPNKVTSIGEFAFWECTSLSSVTIPNSVTSIGYNAFDGEVDNTPIIQTIISFIENPFEIGGRALYEQNEYRGVFSRKTFSSAILYVPKGTLNKYKATNGWNDFNNIVEAEGNDVQTIRTIHVATAGTLSNYISQEEKYQIQELILTGEINGTDFNYIREMTGDSVDYISPHELLHFATNGKLRKIDISEAQIVDGGDACTFVYDYADREFYDFPTVANTIYHYQFSGYNLKEIILPNSVTSIGAYAFEGCSELTFITIPSSVTHINSSAFSGCSGLTSIIVEAGNAVYDSRDNSNAIIETASNTLIIGCQNTIISNSVTSIGLLALGGCNTLMDVYCYAETVPETDRYAFGYDDTPISNAILHVPAGSISAYRNAEPWCYFKEIVPLDGSGVQTIETDNRVIQINSIRGERLEEPSKGINVMRMKDGSTKKVLIK